jgi:catechol 2,3-dioxygenase-like lactoylglutathione lyase family enzyme
VIQRVHSIGLAVADFKRSAQWYRRLGFDGASEQGNAGLFQAGDAVLYIFQTDSPEVAERRELDPVHDIPGWDHMSFRVDDVDSTYRILVEGQVDVQSPPTNQDWGYRTAAMRDPDGNVVWLVGPLKH